jgi:hypothetical protein
MSDLVKELWDCCALGTYGQPCTCTYCRAAAEIERLVGERDDLRSFSDEQADAIAASIKERDALRAALREIRERMERGQEGTTHWDGCSLTHIRCACIPIIDRALLDGGTDEKVASS